jgi:serine/threonine protein kinase/Tfp pilus assembly protein PilF
MKCSKCHFENSSDNLFCSKCGTQILSSEKTSLPPTKILPTAIRELSNGSTFAGRYQIIEELGKGGMGRVYKVLDNEIKETIALKLLNLDIAADENMIERFRNELKLARKISHKNVCRMYHLGEDEGTYFITMEYVPGEDLKSLIRRVGQLTAAKAVSIARQSFEGLAEAHKIGIVHRDLKPQNVMIDKEGNVRIMDFGIARFQESKGITDTGAMIGTPEYMSPEQVEGEEVDGRSDIYSSGVMLYEMVTGCVPFEGNTPLSVALKHRTEIPREPKEFSPHIPEVFNRLILKCLEKNREKRYQRTEEVLSDLYKIEKEIPTKEMIIERKKPRKIRLISQLKLKWALALLMIGFLIFGGYHLWKGVIQPQPDYENFILLEASANEPKENEKDLIEYLLQRSITASSKLSVIVQDEFAAYKKKTESAEEKPGKPIIFITSEVYPKAIGFEILIFMRNKGKTSESQKFECKGPVDLISNKIGEILSFISDSSDGKIEEIEGSRTFSQICTGDLNALEHFFKGEEARNKLDRDNAIYEYLKAIEYDKEFSLARLKIADVYLFMGDREAAKENLQMAWDKRDKFIKHDRYEYHALKARADYEPIKEQHYRTLLKEEFPFQKEYYYELAESYFKYAEAGKAIKHYSDALKIDPDYSLAHNHIAFCHSWLGNHDRAEEHFNNYVKLDNTANSYDSLASGYMFAGRYDEAIKELNKGIEKDPNLDWFYANLARNFILKGSLTKAIENLKKEEEITPREETKKDIHFYQAYVESLRGNVEKSEQELQHVLEFYSSELYADYLDDSANLPFWLTGILAAEKEDLKKLKEMLYRMEQKIKRKTVNATKYFPIYKYYIHLKILEGYLQNDKVTVLENIEEATWIKEKLGYWDSMFNLSYFFNEYAKILIKLKMIPKASELLKEAIEYNPNYAASHLNMARVHLNNNKREEALKEYQKTLELLTNADKDHILVAEAKKIEKMLTSRSISD